MSRSPLKIREILLLSLPLALIGVSGWFLSQRQQTLRVDSSGPYRVEITRIEEVPVTPFEAWQGFDTKIVVQVKESGNIKLATKGGSPLSHQMDHDVLLYGTIKGQLRKIRRETSGISDSISILADEELPPPQTFRVLQPFNTSPTDEKGTPVEEKITLLVATSAFDIAAPVALRGPIYYRNGSVFSKAAMLNKTVRKAGGRKEVHVDRTPSIPIPSVSVSNFSPHYAHTSFLGDNGNCFVKIRFKNALKPDARHHLHLVTEGFYDAHGKRAVFKLGPSMLGYLGGVDEVSSPDYALIKRLHNEDVIQSKGEVNMRLAISIGDGWPTQVNAVVWPAWFSRLPKTLQLRRIVVEGGSVIVNAHYSGSKTLEYKTFDKLGALQYFDSRQEVGDESPPKAANEDRLFTDWSQHFIMPNGRSYWYENAVSVQDIECDPKNNCRITYTTKALDALKPGQSAKFHAEIGIEDDGFIPIDAVITRPKTTPRNLK